MVHGSRATGVGMSRLHRRDTNRGLKKCEIQLITQSNM